MTEFDRLTVTSIDQYSCIDFAVVIGYVDSGYDSGSAIVANSPLTPRVSRIDAN